MPELRPDNHNSNEDETQDNFSLNHIPQSYQSLPPYTYYPSNLIYNKGLNASPIMLEPSLQGLKETEVFVGEEEENFLQDDESHLNGLTPSSLIINYHKDPFLHPLNSVKEEIEAEAAEEEMSGNFHSLDYLGLSAGGSSLSSSAMSSVSLDEVVNCNACIERHGAASCKYHQIHGPSYCPHHLQMYRDSSGTYGICDKNIAICKVKHAHLSNSSGKLSPASSCRISPNHLKNATPNSYSKDVTSCRLACCKTSTPQKSCSTEKSKVCSEKKNPVWHNPSKSDKLSTTKKDSSSLLKRYGFCRAKSEAKENYNDSTFSSLPRKKKEKNEKDIAAETYGTLGRNRKKKEKPTAEPNVSTPQNNEKPVRELTHDSKNTLDKYATLPRKRAKELSSKWREQNSQKEGKEVRPLLQRSKSTGKNESSRSTRATPSPCFSTSSTPNISSPRNPSISSRQTQNTKLANKVISPSMKLLAKQSHAAGKEKADKSPSPKVYLSTSQPKLTRSSKKNAAVQVNLQWDVNENELAEKLQKLGEENSLLQSRLRNAEANAEEVEQMRMEAVELRRTAENEKMEKEELQEELDRTSGKVKEMLASMEGVEKEFNNRGESLIELENQLQTSSEFNMKMQDKLNQYEDYTIKLRKDLDKSLAAQKILLQQVQDLEGESREMAEFMAEEKNSLAECLKEAELEIGRQRKEIEDLKGKLQHKEEEARHMVRLAEERRRGYLNLQTELKCVQSSAEDMMVCQGAQVSEASVGLAHLTSRLQIITGKLIQDYTISENDIENVVTPVDSDSSISSSATGTPDLQKSPVRTINRSSSPRKPVSFMQSFLNAMRIAQTSSKLLSVAGDESGTVKAFENIRSPDDSERRSRCCQEASSSNNEPSSQSLSDQVGEVDLLLTRFMKVCCVLKSDADNILSELEDENERLCSQIQLQQQMIDQQYAEFESLSNLESNARKELKLITKDLEFANATLNKVCDDDTKLQVKNVDEALRAINLNLGRMDTMHAEKRDKITQARYSLPNAHGRIHSQNSVESSNGKHKISGPPHIRVSRCKKHRRECKQGDGPEEYLNSNSSDEKEDKDNELDYVVNHVLKTLEAVPDIVSNSAALKNLYLHLTSADPFEKDVNCNPSSFTLSNATTSANVDFSPPLDSNSTTPCINLVGKEITNGDGSSNGKTPVNVANTELSDTDSFATACGTSLLYQSSPPSVITSPFANGTGDAVSHPVNGSLQTSPTIPVDCNANPKITVTDSHQESRLNASDPIRLIPLLTNETSL